MLIAEESNPTTAAPSTIWSLWRDVSNWKAWDPDVAWSRLDAAFELGARGELKPTKGPKSAFAITHLVPEKLFVDESRLPLARLIFRHELSAIGEKTQVTHRIEIEGPLARFFGLVIGRGLREGLPIAVRNLVAMAEQQEAAKAPRG